MQPWQGFQQKVTIKLHNHFTQRRKNSQKRKGSLAAESLCASANLCAFARNPFFCNMKTLLCLFIAVIISLYTAAQTQYTGWLASFHTIKTGKKTSIHNDIQLRSTNHLKQMQTLLLRGGLNIHITKKLTVTAGYAFISNRRTISNVTGYAPEHRIWQQLLYTHRWKQVAISHRFRVEQRFIAKSTIVNNELENEGSAYANRLRYFIRNILPLRKAPSFDKGVFAALQNEVFVNFGNTANVNGEFFDQNRFYLAVGYRIHKSFDIEAGYMNQYINGRTSITNNHIAQLAGYLRL